MANYVFKFTDPLKTSFTVREFGANGPLIPSAVLPLATAAVSANTSLTLVGKGLLDYGRPIQENLIYLTENFANSTPPAYPIEGQLWYKNTNRELSVYDSANWNTLFINGASLTSVDFNAQRAINLDDPIDLTDAATKGYSDTTFVALAGSTMTGFLTLSGNPTSNLHAVPKQFLDAQITTINDTIAAITGTTNTIGDKVNKAGDTMTGPLVMEGTAININAGSSISVNDGSIIFTGASVLDMGNNRIASVATPVNPPDAANKQYVDDTAISILDATHDLVSGIVTLETDAAPVALVSAPLAPFNHLHSSDDVGYIPAVETTKYSATVDYYTTTIFGSPSLISVNTDLDVLNTILHSLISKTDRHVAVGSGTTTMTLPFNYPVNADKLSVYKNGIKLYREERAQASIVFPAPVFLSNSTTLTTGIYKYNLSVDGTPYTDLTLDLSLMTGVNAVSVGDLIRLLQQSLTTPAETSITFSVALVDDADLTGLVAGTMYGATITVNGTPFSVVVAGDVAQTYADLMVHIYGQTGFLTSTEVIGGQLRIGTVAIGSEATITVVDAPSGPTLGLFSSLANFTSIGAPGVGTTTATVTLDRDGSIKIMSPTVGVGSAMLLSPPTTGTNLFTTLGATTSDQTISSVYDYSETGVPTRYSTTVTFPANTSAADKYEFIVQPHMTHTDANGNFV